MRNLFTRIYILFTLCLSPLMLQAQSYDQLWNKVETLQKKDLPKSVIQQVNVIYTKALKEKNIPQLMKAQLIRASEQVKLTPDSAEVAISRLKAWAEKESDKATAALLYHVIGNIVMQKSEPDWKEALYAYRNSLKDKEVLLKTSAIDFMPMTVSTSFSKLYFQDNLYDLLVRQSIAGLKSNWNCNKEKEVVEWIIDLYDSLIESYRTLGNQTATLLTHEAKILYLNDSNTPELYRLSDEKAEKALKDLLHLYQVSSVSSAQAKDAQLQNKDMVAVDALVDVCLKLSENLCNQQKLTEAMEILQAAQSNYPSTTLKDAVRKKMEWIKVPSLTMQIPVVYPSYKGRLVANYKNISEVKVETYRLRLAPTSPELNGNLTNEILCRNYGTKIATQNFRLPATPDYQPRIEKLPYQLPEEGIYIMKAIPVDRKGKPDYHLLYVTPYQSLLIPTDKNHTEIIVVDQLTGNPVPHAEVVEFQRANYTTCFTPHKIWKTNSKGSVVIPTSKQNTHFYNVRTPGNDFMKVSPLYAYGNTFSPLTANKGWKPGTTLFTDRSLYRPGQTVHVSGIRYEQLGDSLRTLTGKEITIELKDVNRKTIGKQSATSDAFGVFSADITLPQQVLPGHFTLHAANKTISIRVENYKRPTFDVIFTPIKKTYTFDDAVSVKGNVQTFAGAPVRLAKGTYQVVRSEAWLWRSGGAESFLASGSFSTDAEGKFTIDVNLESPFNKKEIDQIPYYNYKVIATVTDGSGETQTGELNLPVGKQSIGIQINGLKSKLARERQEKMQFQVMNLSKQLVQTEVTYQVFALDNNAEKSTERLVYEGKAMAQKSFIPHEIYALSSGSYRLKANARDDQGRLASVTKDFILFSLADKRPPIKTIHWFYQDGENWENNQPVSVYIGSSNKQVYLLMDVYTANKRIRSERLLLNNSIQRFNFSYNESYGDGITVSFAFLQEGKLYTKIVKFERPKPKKQLKLKWETFRDQLTPGQQEVWCMKITDSSENPVPANLLATLYDASLDKLYKHQWAFHPNFSRHLASIGIRSLAHQNRTMFYIDFPYRENANGYQLLNRETYSRLLAVPIWNRLYYIHPTARAYAAPMVALKSASIPQNDAMMQEDFDVDIEETAVVEISFEEEMIPITKGSSVQPIRKNFAETAFFYPMLRTDANGEVSISFTLPDALTEWKFLGFAHTQGMDFGQLTSKVKSSKPFMVQPNLPRFIRMGDESSLAASLVNLSMEDITGTVRMELIDPMTQQVVYKQEQSFKVGEGKTEVAQFNYQIAEAYDVLICRIVAEAGEFSDGEQHYLPVLTNKQWLTETKAFQLNGEEGISLSLKDLFNRQSRTATDKRLTVELTANPNWYVIQALPVVGNPTNEDAISWATAYYANALAVDILHKHPRIQQVFETWKAEGTTSETLWSKLETNADLKQMLLEETPWLAEAQTETEQKQRIALLFELNGMKQRLRLAIQKLLKLQTVEGGWTWYPGMPANRYTTIQIVKLMARLQYMGVHLDSEVNAAYQQGLNYLKEEIQDEYQRIIKREAQDGKFKTYMSYEQVVHYLYICALDPQAQQTADKKVNDFFIERLLNPADKSSIYEKSASIHQKATMAIVMQANGRSEVASTLLQSIKEYLISTPEMGAYFDTHKATYSWNSYRIPTHVAAMEAIHRVHPDTQLLNAMKQWLLKEKQVQVWNTPVATVDAIYAFLLTNPEALTTSGKIKATLGKQQLTTPTDGLGYTRKTYTEKNAEIQNVQIQKEGAGIGWGAVYAQCFETMKAVKGHQGKGMQIERNYILNGQPIDKHTILRKGDALTIRLQVKVDRDMDFVMIKDERAACMEPADQMSGYHWQKGTASYRVNKDSSTEFFIDKLRKGNHVFEYKVFVDRTGKYQAGTASIQTVYAPEFTAHSEGASLRVE